MSGDSDVPDLLIPSTRCVGGRGGFELTLSALPCGHKLASRVLVWAWLCYGLTRDEFVDIPRKRTGQENALDESSQRMTPFFFPGVTWSNCVLRTSINLADKTVAVSSRWQRENPHLRDGIHHSLHCQHRAHICASRGHGIVAQELTSLE